MTWQLCWRASAVWTLSFLTHVRNCEYCTVQQFCLYPASMYTHELSSTRIRYAFGARVSAVSAKDHPAPHTLFHPLMISNLRPLWYIQILLCGRPPGQVDCTEPPGMPLPATLLPTGPCRREKYTDSWQRDRSGSWTRGPPVEPPGLPRSLWRG